MRDSDRNMLSDRNSAKGMLTLISLFQGTHIIWPTPVIILPTRSQFSPDLTCICYLTATYLLGKCRMNNVNTSGWGMQNKGCKQSYLPFLTWEILVNLQDYFQYLNRMHPPVPKKLHPSHSCYDMTTTLEH